jgi:hypothetical protein
MATRELSTRLRAESHCTAATCAHKGQKEAVKNGKAAKRNGQHEGQREAGQPREVGMHLASST